MTARTLAKHRAAVAEVLDAEMRAAWIAGDFALSNGNVARLCAVTEKVVRDWRTGERGIPLAALHALPARLVEPLLEKLQKTRGLAPQRKAAADLASVIAVLEQPASEADRAEIVRVAADGMAKLAAIVARGTKRGDGV